MNLDEIIKRSIGNWDYYCDGYSKINNNCYICVVTVHTNETEHRLFSDKIIDLSELYEINAFDLAEASGPYVGQINMIPVSSFLGPNGLIWGLDVSRHEKFADMEKLLLNNCNEIKRHDDKIIKVYSAEPLIHAARSLLGTVEEQHFPPYPGAHVPCINSFYHSKKRDNCVFSSIGIGIPEDHLRSNNAVLFMQYTGGIKNKLSCDKIKSIINKSLAKSVMEVGRSQHVLYKEILVHSEIRKIPKYKYGCAFTAVPFLTLAKKSIPSDGPTSLIKYSLSEWEDSIKNNFLFKSKR